MTAPSFDAAICERRSWRTSFPAAVAEALSRLGLAAGLSQGEALEGVVALTAHRYGGCPVPLFGGTGTEGEEGDWWQLHPELLSEDEKVAGWLRRLYRRREPATRPGGIAIRPPDRTVTGPSELFRDVHCCPVFAHVRPGDRERSESVLADACTALVLRRSSGPEGDFLFVDSDRSRIDPRLVKAFASHVLSMAREMARRIEHPVRLCTLGTPSERRRWAGRGRGPEVEEAPGSDLRARFERCARRQRDRTALIDAAGPGAPQILSYGALKHRADHLAADLRRAGVAAGDRVAVALPRSSVGVAALLAVLQVEGVYVPLDAAFPEPYRQAVLEDSCPAAWIMEPPGRSAAGVCVEPLAGPSAGPAETRGPEAERLLFYTSGSTGRPKGVVHRERQMLRRLSWMWKEFPFAEGEVACHRSSPSVMPSLWEILGGLLAGVPTLIVPPAASNLADLAELIERHRVSRITLLPSLLERLLGMAGAACRLRSLRWVTVGGEMAEPSLARRLRRLLPACSYLEDYGCTEVNTIWAAAATPRREDAERLQGGRSLPGLGVYVVGRDGRPVPDGVLGEVRVAGGSLALYYHRRPRETAQSFVPNAIDPRLGARLYRTGDLGYHSSDGDLRLVGRGDHQLKVRGYRIEPSEIETVLGAHPKVEECCALSRGDLATGGELVVFVVPARGPEPRPAEVRAFLAESLPAHMVPTRVLMAGSLPRTASGKLDRRTLVRTAALRAQPATPEGGADPERLRLLLARRIGQSVEELDDDTPWAYLGLDSLRMETFAGEVSREFGVEVTPITLFDHPSPSSLAAFLSRPAGRPAPSRPLGSGSARQAADSPPDGIAVIGMAGRFPHAPTIADLWGRLLAGHESIGAVPPSRSELADLAGFRGGFFDDVRSFDPAFFGISPADAAVLDPQHRLALEEAWNAFEDAGLAPSELSGHRVGVFLGVRPGGFERVLADARHSVGRAALLGNDPAMLAARVAARMDLRGPAFTIDTACSSSLAAVHLAAQSLWNGECDLALAGGVCLVLSADALRTTARLGILSAQGRCCAFAAAADGFVQGEGAGFVVLQRLRDAKEAKALPRAVIRGVGANQDGRTNGLGAPSSRAQSDLQLGVYARYGLDPSTFGYVEGHGTGTPVGDPIEVEALTRSFRAYTEQRGFCALGSLKPNIGHLTAAAGVAGLIKAVLCLQHRLIPPSVNFDEENPLISFGSTPFVVNRETIAWRAPDHGLRRAAVNSFGLSGTNVHCVLEEAPEPDSEAESPARGEPAIPVWLSAATPGGLERRMDDLAAFLSRPPGERPELRDVAHTLWVGRERMACGRSFRARDREHLIELLTSGAADPQPAAAAEAPPPGRRVALPGYPFERRVCWPSFPRRPELLPAATARGTHAGEPATAGGLAAFLRQALADLLAVELETLDPQQHLDAYGYDSLAAVDLAAKLGEHLGREVPLETLSGRFTLAELTRRLDDPAKPSRGFFPLTSVQAAYLWGKRPGGGGVGCHTYLELEIEDPDIEGLERAWNRLVERHPMLRARIERSGQRILDEVPYYAIAVQQGADQASLEATRAEMSHRLYPAGAWPLFEIRVSEPVNRPAVVHVSMDSWIADGRSAEILFSEWRLLYEEPSAAPEPLETTFEEYLEALEARRSTPEGRRQREYWRGKLEACPGGPHLPAPQAPPDGRPVRFRRRQRRLEPAEWEALKDRAASLEVFATSLILAALAATLRGDRPATAFGLVLTHAHRRRFRSGIERVVAPFTSTSVCRVGRDEPREVDDLARSLHRQTIRDLQHRDVCASSVLSELARETGHLPELPVVFTGRLGGEDSDRGLLERKIWAVSQTPGVVLECRAETVGGGLEVAWDVAETRVDPAWVEARLDEFLAALRESRRGVALSPTDLQASYRAERLLGDGKPWAEAMVYQELDLDSEPSAAALQTALGRLYDREPLLAARWSRRGELIFGEPLPAGRPPPVGVDDLRFAAAATVEERLGSVQRYLLADPGPQAAPIRLHACRLPSGGTRLHLASDMAMADGYSLLLLYRRLLDALLEGTDKGVRGWMPWSHGAFVRFLRRRAEADRAAAESDRSYWTERVRRAPPGPELPAPSGRSSPPLAEEQVRRLEAEPAGGAGLLGRAAARGVRPEAVLVAAFTIVLAAAAQSRPFTTVVAVAGRDRVAPEAPDAIGDFTAFSWVTDEPGDGSFADCVRRIDRRMAADLARRRSSPLEARRALHTSGEARPVTAALTSCLTAEPWSWPLGVRWGRGVALTPGVALDCYVHNVGGVLGVHWDYRPALLAKADTEAMFGAFVGLLSDLECADTAWDREPAAGVAAGRPAAMEHRGQGEAHA